MNFDDYDLQGQATDLATRKAMIDALVAKAAKPQIGHAIMGLFGAGPEDRAKPLQEAYQRDSAAHNQRYQGQMGQELGAFMDRMQGAPARPPEPDYSGNAVGPAVPAQAANPREAIVRAMTSQLPEMQAMGKASMSAFGKPRELKEHVIGNQLVVSDGQGGAKVAGTFNKADWVDEDRVINGQQVPGQRNKQDNQWMPRSAQQGTTINLDTKGAGKLQDVALKAMEDTRGTVMGVQKQLDAAQRVLALAEDPQVMTGFGANAITGFSALGAKLGLNGPEGVAKTQALMTDLAQKALDAGQQMKGSFSDNDIKFLKDVTAGSVEYNAETIKHMALLAYTGAHNTLQSALGQYHGAKGKAPAGTEEVIPLPKVSYDARISDRPGFSIRDGGYLRYDGVPGQAKAPAGRVNSQGRRRMTVDEFLSGGQDATN